MFHWGLKAHLVQRMAVHQLLVLTLKGHKLVSTVARVSFGDALQTLLVYVETVSHDVRIVCVLVKI